MHLPEQTTYTTRFSDIDLLTGCFNLVRFSKDIEKNFGHPAPIPVTLITLDFRQLKTINHTRGFEHGDQLLRWLGIVLRDAMGNTIYRISGQHFVTVLAGESIEKQEKKARKLFNDLNYQAKQLGLETPVVAVAVIHFSAGQPLTTAWVWKNINEKMEQVRTGTSFLSTQAEPLTEKDGEVIHAIELMALRIVGLGQMMNVTFNNAYTDPVSNLPNVMAVQRRLELTLAEATTAKQEFSVLLLDGDDLKRYNEISYTEGDELIKQMSKTMKAAIRPGDFVGRWRFGDEFVIIMPNTSLQDAILMGDHIREVIYKTSQTWRFPTTVSAGAVHFPQHGLTLDALIAHAQKALAVAKAAGKNKTVAAESE